jgi:hypothetical protein
MDPIFESYTWAITEGKKMIVYRGSTQKSGGSAVGMTLGKGVYVTSNKDDTSKGNLAAIDYAGGKFTKGKKGIITTFELKITDKFLVHNEEYYLDELVEDKRLAKWFRERIQRWINDGYYKDGIDGKSLLLYTINPPPYLGKKADIAKAGFDGFVQYNDNGTIYEAVIFNQKLLKKIGEEDVTI